MTLTRTRRNSRRSPGEPSGGRCAPGRHLPLLALTGTAASARELSPRPAAPAGRRNDQRQARELQGRPSSRRSSMKPGKITYKGASRHA